MKWYEEIAKELIVDFKGFALRMVFKHCGPLRTKLNKERMNNLIMTSQCRGGVSALDELLKFVDKEQNVDKDFILANIQLLRMNIWNMAAEHSEGLKKIDINTAMQIYPDPKDLLQPDRYIVSEYNER